MANADHLELLKRGVKGWNRWRTKDPGIIPNLCGANLSEVDLRGVDLSRTDLNDVSFAGADLSDAILSHSNLSYSNLSYVTLSRADLCDVNLSGAILSGADLSFATLSRADLSGVDLIRVDLRNVNLSRVDLIRVDLRNVDLSGAILSGANLSEANLHGSDLSQAILIQAQVLGTNFKRAVFTGACLEDWNINSSTSFEGTICNYVYLKADQQERRPREGSFKSGEFAALFQQAVDTVDLIFKDGIDWQAFFQSFQDLRSQYVDQDLSIQGIEKKRGGAFVVRLEVPAEADKTVIESLVKELYASEMKALETQYEERLRLQGEHLEDARQTIEIERREKATLMGVMTTMANSQQGPKYDMRGAQFGGGYVAGNVQGNQYGGVINNYGSNAEDITRLLTALRDQAQTFPTDQKDDANDVLDDLERDLADEQPDQGRIGRRLKKLVALGAALGTIVSGAAAVSGDVSTFTGNVIELTEKLGIPIEQVQLPPSGTP